MNTKDLFDPSADSRAASVNRVYAARCLTVLCRLAVENDTSAIADDLRSASVSTGLELVADLLFHLEDGVEMLARDASRASTDIAMESVDSHID